MSEFLFMPNEFSSKMLFDGAKFLNEQSNVLYNTFVVTIIMVIIYFIVIKSCSYVKIEFFDVFIVLPLFICWGYINYKDPYNILTKYPRATILVNIFMFFSLLLLVVFKNQFYNSRTDKIPSSHQLTTMVPLVKKLFLCFSVIIFIFIVVICLVWGVSNMPGVGKTFEYIMLFLVIIGGGGISYLYFNKKYNHEKDKDIELSLMEKVLYYLPCLLIEIIDAIKLEYKITTKTVWILFALEIVFISIYFLIPIIVTYITTYNTTLLLGSPVYLNNNHTLGKFENLKPSSNMKGKYEYEYSISGWFYINPQPPSTNKAYVKYTTIFNYANKPLIQYNSLNNMLRVQTDIGKNNIKTLYLTNKISYQKWINFVINYDGSNMDLFLNGELVGTIANVAPYMYNDNIQAGSIDGIHGGVCNIRYDKKPLSKRMIKTAYNILKTYNTPLL